MTIEKDYLNEDLLYEELHQDGKPYYRQEADDPCAPEFAYLFTWDSFPRKDAQLLELGCGDGFHTAVLVKMGLAVTGVDCSPTAIRHARDNLKNMDRPVTFQVADVCNLSFSSESFPYILDCHCLHCVTDYQQRLAFLNECRRVLKPQGRLFMATMAAQPMDWTKDYEGGRHESKYDIDERGCYVHHLAPSGAAKRSRFRIFVTEGILRDEIKRAGLDVVRFETFAPDKDPNDLSFLVEAGKCV